MDYISKINGISHKYLLKDHAQRFMNSDWGRLQQTCITVV